MNDICNRRISAVITNLRFPLILGVVLIHNVLISPEEAVNNGMFGLGFFIELMSRQLTAPCVPLFFFFSGYLFFRKYSDSFSFSDYSTQVVKRFRTLVVPYIFWNAMVLLFFALVHRYIPSLINPEFNNVYSFSAIDWIRSFWDCSGGQPICYQFWFLRDLIIAVALSPVIYFVIKYGKWYLMILLCVAYCYDTTLFPFQIMLTFFSLGAGFAIHKYDFVTLTTKSAKIAIPLYCLFVITGSVKIGLGGGLSTLVGAITYICMASRLSIVHNNLSDSSFFIYAFHGLPILVLSRLLVKVLHPSETIMWLVCYMINFILVITLSISVYVLIKRLFPKLTAVITGGR